MADADVAIIGLARSYAMAKITSALAFSHSTYFLRAEAATWYDV